MQMRVLFLVFAICALGVAKADDKKDDYCSTDEAEDCFDQCDDCRECVDVEPDENNKCSDCFEECGKELKCFPYLKKCPVTINCEMPGTQECLLACHHCRDCVGKDEKQCEHCTDNCKDCYPALTKCPYDDKIVNCKSKDGKQCTKECDDCADCVGQKPTKVNKCGQCKKECGGCFPFLDKCVAASKKKQLKAQYDKSALTDDGDSSDGEDEEGGGAGGEDLGDVDDLLSQLEAEDSGDAEAGGNEDIDGLLEELEQNDEL
jgi:hypothetical protein